MSWLARRGLPLAAALAAAVVVAGAARADGLGYHTRPLRVTVPTPNPCWRVGITSVHRSEERLLVVAELEPPPEGAVCAQVVSTATDEVEVQAPPLPVRYVVLGRTWGWQPEVPETDGGIYIYPQSREALEPWLEGTERIK